MSNSKQQTVFVGANDLFISPRGRRYRGTAVPADDGLGGYFVLQPEGDDPSANPRRVRYATFAEFDTEGWTHVPEDSEARRAAIEAERRRTAAAQKGAPMYKTDLVRRVAKETRFSQRTVNAVLTTALEQITQTLRDGQTVVLPGFGAFYTRQRKASQVRHIRTGEVLTIPPMPEADFRVGELLRQAVRKGPRRRRRPATEAA